ncbi:MULTISPECIES: EamA family transporter [Georhizobium]|uniref:EamA family transporter n=1 Tax=Georhizobium TaxID=2661800 RepID=UPI0013DE81EF|nr:EamA family transporter [Georhizobium profundi]
MIIGPLFALFGALAFALANVAIAKGAHEGERNNGAFLSILMTACLSGSLWLLLGPPLPAMTTEVLAGLGFFAASGMLATVVGRLTLFRSVILAGAINAGLFRRLIPIFATLFAFIILGETVGWLAGAGMAIILASLLGVTSARDDARRSGQTAKRRLSELGRGRMFGALSAASYGASYSARKLGMSAVPDPILGTFIGALTGIIWYAGGSLASRNYRKVVATSFNGMERWQFVAALSMSFGQMAQFFALLHTDVAVVAIIGSLEVFLGIYLAAYVFRTEAPPDRNIVVASFVATIGVVLVALP